MKYFGLCLLALLLAAPAAAQTVNQSKAGFSAPGASQVGYLVADVQSGDTQKIRQALDQLRNLEDSHAQQLIQAALTAPDVPTAERRRALEDAARRGKKIGQDMLVLALQRGDDSLKGDAIRLVKGKDADFALPVFKAALNDPKPRIRITAVQAASSMDTAVVRQVLRAATNDRDVTVKMQIIVGAASLPQTEAWDVLNPLCLDSNTTVAARARAAARAKGIDLEANGIK